MESFMKMTRKWKMETALAVIFLLVFAGSLPRVFAGEPVFAGDTYLKVLQKMGTPDHNIKSGRDQLLFYDSYIIELMDDKVVRIDGREAPRPEAAANQAAGAGAGQRAPSGPRAAQRIIDIRQQGKAIDIRPLLVAGGYTVIAFYADW
jgi:hypothetical protein